MVLLAACPIFQSQFIFYGYGNMTALFSVFSDNAQEIFIRRIGCNISLSVFKDTDQADIIIIAGKIRLDILKISDMTAADYEKLLAGRISAHHRGKKALGDSLPFIAA